MGVERHTLRDLELGRRTPQYPTLQKIAKGYGVPIGHLLAPLADQGQEEQEELQPEEPVPLGEAPQAGQSGQEWAREQGARLHAMTDAEFNARVRELGSEEEIAEEFRAFLGEAEILRAAHSAHKRQRPEDKDRRAVLSRDLRELRTYRFAELAAAAKVRKADALFREVIQALDEVAV
jgi:transcriptional regulator with XRE-family HTH domain